MNYNVSDSCVLACIPDDICQYFGVKIAMYFAWLGMYTKWLAAPALLGIVTFILSNRGEVTRDWCILFFNVFNIVWATLFLEAWKRKSAELAYKWGTLDMPSDSLKEPRPLFTVSKTYEYFCSATRFIKCMNAHVRRYSVLGGSHI